MFSLMVISEMILVLMGFVSYHSVADCPPPLVNVPGLHGEHTKEPRGKYAPSPQVISRSVRENTVVLNKRKDIARKIKHGMFRKCSICTCGVSLQVVDQVVCIVWSALS